MSAPLDNEFRPVVLHFGSILRALGDRQFFEFCQLNRDLRIERTHDGDLIIMPPTGGRTGCRNFVLGALFHEWVEKDGTGIAFDSSTGFTLPNGSTRSPDLAWLSLARWEQLSEQEKDEFITLCPEFVIELRSPSDSLTALRAKMEEYIANGTRLGWLLDPQQRKVYVYSPGSNEICLEDPAMVSAEPVLHGFQLNLSRLWGQR